MFHRTTTRSGLISLAALLTALSLFFATPTDVGAALAPSEASARAAPTAPIEIPHEWVWRGREPVSLEFMYGNRPQPQADWIRMNHAQ
jgi:hypothetical protein